MTPFAKMVFGPFGDVWNWLRNNGWGNPFMKRHWNFLTIHCGLHAQASHRKKEIQTDGRLILSTDCYMIGIIIISSVMIYPAGGMRYIDALFFAAGATTQSGLNT